MDFHGMTETLTDEYCGLHFLAGVDLDKGKHASGVLTVHSTAGTVTDRHRHFIEDRFAALYPDFEIRFRLHSKEELHSPDSLESFGRRFQHDHIVSDPTGAFARVSELLNVARLLRTELGSSIDRILWQADTSALVVLAAPVTLGAPDSREPETVDRLRVRVNSLIESGACPDLRKIIKSVQVNTKVPSGRFTAVDSRPGPAPVRKRTLTAMLARVSAIAALIGIGTLSTASAGTSEAVKDELTVMPGITGLVGLTTLGENSYGLRNRYQSLGGLRLYFRETGVLMASVLASDVLCAADCQPVVESEIDDVEVESEPAWPMPSRVAYGT